MDLNHLTKPTTRPPRPPATPRPAIIARSGADRARLNGVLDRAAEYVADGGRMLEAVERVSHRYGRLACYWRRPPTPTEKAAIDLACVQAGLAVADHLVPVRAGGAA